MGLLSSIIFNGSKLVRFVIKYEPQIERAVGIGLYAGAVYTTYLATKKQESIKESYNYNMDSLEGRKVSGELTEDEYRKERKQVTRAAVGHSILNWAPTALCFGGGTTCFLRSTHVLVKRGMASAALAELWKQKYEEYRENVKKVNGDQVEEDLYKGKTKAIVKDKKGKVVDYVEETFKTHGSPYSLLVGPETLDRESYWDNSSDDYNVMTVRLIEERANKVMTRYGHVWLEDVIKDLGLWDTLVKEKKLAFHNIGWLLDKCGGKTPENGIKIKIDMIPRRSFGGGEAFLDYRCKANPFWIDFNVEGNIMTKMEKRVKQINEGAKVIA